MTNNNHPITPPPELVQQWCYEDGDEIRTSPRWYQRVCAKAARWGADQELEACCKWLDFQKLAKHERMVSYLRAIRRPKPPSLKEEALAVIENSEICDHVSIEQADILRRALDALPS